MSSKKYFEEVAINWDNMREEFFSVQVRNKAFDIVNFNKDMVVADIGCGTGYITEGLIDKGLKIIAVDQSDKMLQIMKDKFRNYNHIDYLIGNFDQIPIATNSIDVAFANMYLHHVDEPEIAIREIYRILKLGGKLIITDLDKHNFSFLKTEHHDRWMGFERIDVEKWYTEAGFKNSIVDCIGETCKSNSLHVNESAEISVFIATGEK